MEATLRSAVGPGRTILAARGVLAGVVAGRYMGGSRRQETTALDDAQLPAPAVADPPPWFRAHVFMCCNRRPDGHPRGSCAARGSEKLRDYMKVRAKELGLRDIRVNVAGCLDRCEFGPTMVIYPEGIWYNPRSPADIDEILSKHVMQGGRVPRLMLTERDVPPPKD